MIQTHQNLPAVTFIYPFREDSNFANKRFHLMRVPKFIDDPIREKRHRRNRSVRVVSLAKIRFLMENDFWFLMDFPLRIFNGIKSKSAEQR